MDMKRIEIGRFRDKIAKAASPLTSYSVIELIGRVLNWAVDEGIIDVNPAARMRKSASRRRASACCRKPTSHDSGTHYQPWRP